MDKQVRITLLLLLDSVFAVLELVVGYAVHSLALVADSFHMFNDILSLVVALWAVKVSRSGSTPTFSYGLQRAEILGALVNAVFLLALCVTILLEAIQRFIEPPEISQPKLVLVVGILGLLSNFLGLILFHEHGHSHGGHGHSHGDEEQHSHSHRVSEAGIGALMPENVLAREEQRLLSHATSYGATSSSNPNSANHSRANSYADSRELSPEHTSDHSHSHSQPDLGGHDEHHHSRPKGDEAMAPRKSMNMEGVFLHVLGDALGNIGVIISALFIWKTSFSWRFYMDPLVSLFITAIIFASAVPLCMRASKVLLQATPSFVNCEEVLEDIQSLPGVQEVHDLHIWQLSEDRVVGTLHVTVNGPASTFSAMSRTIQQCFAGHGVPSITIQPEFVDEPYQNSYLRQCQSNGNLLERD
nr:Zrc1 [Starmerella bombicola]